MNRRIKITIVFSIVLLLALWLARFYPRPEAQKEPSASKSAASVSQSGPQRAIVYPEVVSNISPAAVQAEYARYVKEQEEKLEASTGMNVPVDFWGRVVDQDERPLAGVNVTLEIAQLHFGRGDFTKKSETNRLQSDARGLFSLTGRKGDRVSVLEIHKEGYKLAEKSRMSFGYVSSRPFRADSENPVTYRMWKLRGAEPTITHEKKRFLKDTALPLSVNLTTGESSTANVEKPDLKITVECEPPLNRLRQNDLFDWRVSIQAVGGGLQFTTNTFMYWAPDDGYRQTYEFGARRGDTNWHYGRNQLLQFYVKTTGGHYARVGMEIQLWAGSGVQVAYSSVLNPSGSRNLERDPMKYVPLPQR